MLVSLTHSFFLSYFPFLQSYFPWTYASKMADRDPRRPIFGTVEHGPMLPWEILPYLEETSATAPPTRQDVAHVLLSQLY